MTHEKLYRHLIEKGSLVIPLVFISLGFVANFGLLFMPTNHNIKVLRGKIIV